MSMDREEHLTWELADCIGRYMSELEYRKRLSFRAAELVAKRGFAAPARCDAQSGGVSFSEEETYALFLILDTLARIRKGKDETVNYMRERTLPAYREWHKQNPWTARAAFTMPSAQSKDAAQ